MYSRLRAASSSPSVCFICSHLLRQRWVTVQRDYTAQATLATRPPRSTSLEPCSSDQLYPTTGSSYSQSSSDPLPCDEASDLSSEDSQAKLTASRKSLDTSGEAERRRKALAVLGKTSKFAAAVKVTHMPTLEDIEQLRPKRPPLISLESVYSSEHSALHRESPSDTLIEQYNAEFQELVETLIQKFTRNQLLNLYREGKRRGSNGRFPPPRQTIPLKTRQDIAGGIIRLLWKWPRVAEVIERKAYVTGKSERRFPIGTSEFFLLLGPDGSSLLSLTESLRVVIKQVVQMEDAFALVVEGPNHALDHLGVVLADRKKAIQSVIISVDTPRIPKSNMVPRGTSTRPELLQRISKLSEALVEDKGNGRFQISAHHPRNIEMATRLVTRASQQTGALLPSLLLHLSTPRDVTSRVTFPETHAFFPFEPPIPSSVPWDWIPTGLLSTSPTLFRARKVNDWLSRDISSESGFQHSLGRVITPVGELRTLQDALSLLAPESSDYASGKCRRREVTVSTGYVAFAAGSGASLSPPLAAFWSLFKLPNWLAANKSRMVFIPSIPPPLANSSPSKTVVSNQLVYRSIVPVSCTSKGALSSSTKALQTLKIECFLKPQREAREKSLNAEVHTDQCQERRTAVSPAQLEVWSGCESVVNIMLPDRIMDVQLSLFDLASVPSDSEPPEIKTYASNLAQCFGTSSPYPDPPLHITFRGTSYILISNATVRRSSHSVMDRKTTRDVLIEHAFDLESHRNAFTCRVICAEPNTPSEWQNFLDKCDTLTGLVEKKEVTTPEEYVQSEDAGDDDEAY